MDNLIIEFLTETNEGLQELDTHLITLEQNPNDKNLISKIFRLMHTIKGTCGFLGLPRLEKVAHHAENVMGRFRAGNLEVTAEYVSLILESLDRVRFLLSHIEAHGNEPEGDDSELIEKLDTVYEGRDGFQSFDSAESSTEFETPVLPSTPVKPKESTLTHHSLRVNMGVLDNLTTMVSELVLTRNQLLQMARDNKDSGLENSLQRLNHVVSDLQDCVMKTRMQPIGNAWTKLPRIIRDLSIELGKKINLVTTGQETELDRQILEMIKDPLIHMVRNSSDHGIETPAERLESGKPKAGTIHLSAHHEGAYLIIKIEDDGRGLSVEKTKKKIIQNGLATEDEVAHMSLQEIQQYIFHEGFSTADQITSISGRGVGMDIVRTNIEKMGGFIEINSTEGKGVIFTIKIPLTLSIISSLIVGAGGERFAIPQLTIRELVGVSGELGNDIETIQNKPFLRLRGQLLPLLSLNHLLKLEEGNDQYVVVTQVEDCSFGLIVEQLFDIEEIVVKPIDATLKNLPFFSGNTILANGSVIMILDPSAIAKEIGNVMDTPLPALRKILLVDNSPFFRNMLCPVLTRAGYEVVAVESALKALELSTQGNIFDLIISDIEMPDMNGFDFASKVRASKEWQDIPMVAIASHATPEDIDFGYQAGFNKYIAKFDRDTLLDTINSTFAMGGQPS